MRFPRVAAQGRAIAAAASAAFGLACVAQAPDSGAEAAAAASSNGLLAAPADARYLTHLLFAAADGTVFFGSFDQTVEQNHLARAYDVWWSGVGGWRQLASQRDTLPVARAAWRLLPVAGMAVRIGNVGQVVSLAFSHPEDSSRDSVRLRAGEEVSVWTSPTGQRESLGLAVLEAGGQAVAGILFFRRAARALRIPAAGGVARTFLFADSLGNGLVIHEGAAGQPAVAHTWLHGIDAAWGDVVLEATDSLTLSEGWHFEIPDTDLSGDIRPIPGGGSRSASAATLEALVSAGGEPFRFYGLSATLPLP